MNEKYKHLKDQLINTSKDERVFNRIEDLLSKYELDLDDEDFIRLFKIKKSDNGVEWIIDQLSKKTRPLVDILVTYITWTK